MMFSGLQSSFSITWSLHHRSNSGAIKDDRFNPKILSTSEPLIKQSLSWTELNDRSKFALFLQQGQLNTTEASLSEVVLRFVCFVNVYLLRMRQIGNSVEKISNIMKEFLSLRSTAVSCPE